LISAWKIEVVDNVDQKQRDLVLVWRAAVEINVSLWNGDAHF
jgi:hypothetical protein